MPDHPSGVVSHPGPLPPVPPGPIASSLKAHVHQVLNDIPKDKRGAVVGVVTDAGVNLAVAHRTEHERWTVAMWIGKTWTGPVTGGGFIKAAW